MLSSEDRERPVRLARWHLEDVVANIQYLENRECLLKQVEAALAHDDVAAIKQAVHEYVITDMNFSCKHVSMQIYDNTDLLQTLAEYENGSD